VTTPKISGQMSLLTILGVDPQVRRAWLVENTGHSPDAAQNMAFTAEGCP
jgi:hypothetical protein